MMATNVTLSAPLAVDLVVYQGDSGSFRVTITDDLGAPFDVSAATWLAQVRPILSDPPTTTLDVTPVVGDPSSVDVALSSTKSALITGNSVWDLQMTLAGEVTTLMGGAVRLTKDVSRLP